MDTDVNVLKRKKEEEKKKCNECRFTTIQLHVYDLLFLIKFPLVCEIISIIFSFVYIFYYCAFYSNSTQKI